jgi:hypothetical protein
VACAARDTTDRDQVAILTGFDGYRAVTATRRSA